MMNQGGYWAALVVGFISTISMLAVLCTFQCTCCNQAAKLNDTRHPAWGRLKWTALFSGLAFVWPVVAQVWWVTKVAGFRAIWLDVIYSGTVIVFRLSIAIKLFQRPESAHSDAQPLVGGAIAGAPIAVLTTTHPDGRVVQRYVQQRSEPAVSGDRAADRDTAGRRRSSGKAGALGLGGGRHALIGRRRAPLPAAPEVLIRDSGAPRSIHYSIHQFPSTTNKKVSAL